MNTLQSTTIASSVAGVSGFAIKLQFNGELRRFGLPPNSAASFSAVQRRANELFALRATDVVRFAYVDEDGDRITVASDAELEEAISLRRAAGVASLKLDVTVSPASSSSKASSLFVDEVKAMAAEAGADLSTAVGELVEQISSSELVHKFANTFTGAPAPAPAQRDEDDNSGGEEIAVAAPVVHNATCDECHKQIVGVRFKCEQCDDFDFCAVCRAVAGFIHPPTHTFARLESASAPAPAASTPSKALYTIEDVSLAPGTEVGARQNVVKLFKLTNVSGDAFADGLVVEFERGQRLGDYRHAIGGGALEAGGERLVALDLVTPSSPGAASAQFHLLHPNGSIIAGPPLVVSFVVV